MKPCCTRERISRARDPTILNVNTAGVISKKGFAPRRIDGWKSPTQGQRRERREYNCEVIHSGRAGLLEKGVGTLTRREESE